MKRTGHLWEHVVSWDNLLAACRKARRGKRRRRVVEQFEFRRELELAILRQELSDSTYRPGGYNTFMIYDTKARINSGQKIAGGRGLAALSNVLARQSSAFAHRSCPHTLTTCQADRAHSPCGPRQTDPRSLPSRPAPR